MQSDVRRFFEKAWLGSRTSRQLIVRSGRDLPPAAQGCETC
jgi:hypothetical protein